MATYSAGLLRVETLNAEGTSASLSATTVNTTTINTTNMNATNFGFTNIVNGGTLSVSGDTSLASVTASGTLGVTGASTLGHVVASGTLDVSGNTTLKSVVASGTLDVTGATTVGGNLSVSGSTVIGVLDVSGAFVTRGTATMANPSLTGVPVAPTAVDGTNTTQVATTAFVNTSIGTFNNVVNYLADKVYSLYLIDVAQGTQAAPTPFMIVIKFNKEQTFTLLAHPSLMSFNQFSSHGTVYPYTILSTPTASVGAKIQFFPTNSATGRWFRLISGNRQATMTFSVDYKRILGFKEDLLVFPTLTTANTIVNAITTPVSESDFLTKFLAAYTANNGNSLYFVDTSGNYTIDPSGTRVNMGTTYAADTVNWKRNVACALISSNSYVAMCESGNNRLKFAQMLYDGNTLVPYIQDTSGACGTLLAPEFFNPSIDKNDIYNIPMSIHNATKRLNGFSPSPFEPTTTIFLGKNCQETEKVPASGSIPAYLKHIAVRGMDVIVYNHRIHMDPSQMYYLKGRLLMYARHKQSFLNDTFWYPDGPEFRINLNPLMTVTKMIFNDTEIPLHLLKLKNWDNYAKDGRALTFNIAAAIAQTGVTFKYDTDPSGNYTQSGLNKIEIWYQGQYTDKPNSDSSTGLSAHIWIPSTKNVPINTLMKNPKTYDEALQYVSKYNLTSGPYEGIEFPMFNGYIIRNTNTSQISYMLGGVWSDSGIEHYVSDSLSYQHQYRWGPWNDLQEDSFYHQVEIMCPKPFVATAGGKRLTPIESVDGNSVLYSFVPGVKVVGDDYRSSYVACYNFTVRPWAPKVETITLTDGSSIPYYVEITPEMKPFYDTSGFSGNAATMQAAIRSCEKYMGKFPFDTFTLAESMTIEASGMEHMELISLTTNAMGQDYTTIHELVHMWWQHKASYKSNKDFWIDEGFNMFIDYKVWEDISNDRTKFYRPLAGLVQQDMEQGWFAKSIREGYQSNYSYTMVAFIHATMYFNMGAEFKVDASGNYNIKALDASGNIAMDLFSSSGVFESVALLSPINVEPLFLRPLIIDTSGTTVFMNSDYKLVDGSGNGISGKQLWFTDARMDLAGNVIDPFGGAIIAVGETLTSGLKLPAGPVTSYYQPNASNENFWNMCKYILNTFSNLQYDYMSWRKSIGDFVDTRKADWSNKWPSTGREAQELYDQMVNTGGLRELGGTYYKYTIDLSLLPVGTLDVLPRANRIPTLTVGGTGYTNTISNTGFRKLYNITHPIVHLEDSSGNALAGTSANFAGKDFTDKIVLIKRDTVETIQSQMFLANLCGARGIISYNNTTGAYTPSFGTGMIQLPCVGVTNTIGASILAQIRTTPGVTATLFGVFSVREEIFPRLLSRTV